MSDAEKQSEPDQNAEAEEEPKGFEHVTAEDFTVVGLEAPIAASRKVYVRCHGALYSQAHENSERSGDVRAANAYRLLAAVTQMHFKPNDQAEPYGPMFVMDGRRSVIPSDFRGAQSEVFAAVAPGVVNPGLRALLADIAWLNDRKQAAMGHLAISAFCSAIQAVIEGKGELYFENAKATSRNGTDLLRRACQIAHATGWKEPEAGTLKSLIASLSERAFEETDARSFLRIGDLNADYRITDPKTMAERTEILAQSEGLDPDTERSLWELAARSHRQCGCDADSNRCLKCAAECYVRLADGATGMVASSCLMDAIKAMRNIPGTKTRRIELEHKLREVQATILDEMTTVSTEIDISEVIDHARKVVGDMTLAQALLAFAKLARSPAPEKLREEALAQCEKNPLSSIFSTSIFDDEGKLVARSPALVDGDENDAALRHVIMRNESFRRQVAVVAIDRARPVIMAEHPLEARDLLPLAEYSPFVPPGYGDIFALGFARLFGGDYISALHILVPQLENSLRYVLKQAAIDTSSMQSDMTQENRTLSVMLGKDRAALEKIFGTAITFEIENLFDFDGGPSLRHQLAHGLISAAACDSHDAIYACWFIFRLCCLPLFRHWEQVADQYARL